MAKLAIGCRKPDLSFYHKNSEVSYDPTNKFYQSTLKPLLKGLFMIL
jgi:hypothetical protein